MVVLVVKKKRGIVLCYDEIRGIILNNMNCLFS